MRRLLRSIAWSNGARCDKMWVALELFEPGGQRVAATAPSDGREPEIEKTQCRADRNGSDLKVLRRDGRFEHVECSGDLGQLTGLPGLGTSRLFTKQTFVAQQ